MWRFGFIPVGLALLVVDVGYASADNLFDCQSHDAVTAIRACTEIINDGDTKGEELGKAYRLRGIAYSSQDKHEQAVADFDEAVLLNSDDAEAIFKRAYAHQALGNYSLASRDFARAKELYSTSSSKSPQPPSEPSETASDKPQHERLQRNVLLGNLPSDRTRAWLGVQINSYAASDDLDLYGAKQGAMVTLVVAGSAAERAGLEKGDLIVKISGDHIRDAPATARAVANLGPGVIAKIVLERIGGGTPSLRQHLKTLADSGSAAAAITLGRLADDDAQSVQWYRKAAASGNDDAMVALGGAYLNGKGVVKDPTEAVRWYRQAAEAGNKWAMATLAGMYQNGNGLAKNAGESVRWYRKAAEHGHINAMVQLGHASYYGRGVAKDPADAYRWYQRAAQKDNAMAMASLGVMYETGVGVEKNESEASRWYVKAAEVGNVTAMMNLGMMYQEGRGVRKDLEEGATWLQRASEKGFAPAMTNLGVLYENGQGVTRDIKQAVSWYRKAADGGDPQGMANLGWSYHQGRGVGQSFDDAAYWLLAAVEKGHRKTLDYILKNGSSQNASFRKALQRRAQQLGVYSGAIDGSLGPASHRSFKALLGRVGSS